jgi:hypothetical protein
MCPLKGGNLQTLFRVECNPAACLISACLLPACSPRPPSPPPTTTTGLVCCQELARCVQEGCAVSGLGPTGQQPAGGLRGPQPARLWARRGGHAGVGVRSHCRCVQGAVCVAQVASVVPGCWWAAGTSTCTSLGPQGWPCRSRGQIASQMCARGCVCRTGGLRVAWLPVGPQARPCKSSQGWTASPRFCGLWRRPCSSNRGRVCRTGGFSVACLLVGCCVHDLCVFGLCVSTGCNTEGCDRQGSQTRSYESPYVSQPCNTGLEGGQTFAMPSLQQAVCSANSCRARLVNSMCMCVWKTAGTSVAQA